MRWFHNRKSSSLRLSGAAVATAATLSLSLLGTARAESTDPAADRIAHTLSGMTVEQKVGQLFVTYAYGDTATTTDPVYTVQNQKLYGVDNGAELVRKYNLGGVIYFAWTDNVGSPRQIAALSNGLQAAATGGGSGIPLLISADQEGGSVTRIGAPLAISPGNMALAATLSTDLVFDMAKATAQQLRALGINVDDAPVIDTNTNPANAADGARAFGDDPTQTSIFGTSSIQGYNAGGVAATAKHFPGLGSTSVNTDLGVAESTQTRADFWANDLPAFQSAIAAGLDEVMAAHIVARSLDPSGAPASLSGPIVTGILRDQLHYNGVVVTDALNAVALHDYTDAERSVGPVKAGVDELLMPTDLAAAEKAVLSAVQSGDISMQRLDQSVTRLLTLKQKLGLFASSQVDASQAAANVGTAAQVAIMQSAAQSSITLLRNADETLPLTLAANRAVLVTGWDAKSTQLLTDDLVARGVPTSRDLTGAAPSAATIAAAVDAATQVDDIVVLTKNAWNDVPQRQLVAALQATGKPVIVVALGAPYELGYMPNTQTFVAAYGYHPASIQAIADMLYGQQPMGHLPITIRSADDSNDIVAAFGAGLRYR